MKQKQISVVIWMEATDEQIDLVERGLKNLIKGFNPDVHINVIKKEFNLNIPKR